jgi:hypothetical protein
MLTTPPKAVFIGLGDGVGAVLGVADFVFIVVFTGFGAGTPTDLTTVFGVGFLVTVLATTLALATGVGVGTGGVGILEAIVAVVLVFLTGSTFVLDVVFDKLNIFDNTPISFLSKPELSLSNVTPNEGERSNFFKALPIPS